MKPEDAKKRWCPMARVVEVGDGELHGPFNRYHTDADEDCEHQSRCLADGCMVWTWEDHNYSEGRCGLAR